MTEPMGFLLVVCAAEVLPLMDDGFETGNTVPILPAIDASLVTRVTRHTCSDHLGDRGLRDFSDANRVISPLWNQGTQSS